jgi:outer membrane protein
MRFIQTGLLAFLTLAVLFLLYREFTGRGSGEDGFQPSGEEARGSVRAIRLEADSANRFGAVAFVNTDTLLERFENFRSMRGAFEARSMQAEREIGNRMRALETEYMEVQKKIQAGTMTETLIKDAEQTLMRKQQELARLKDERTAQLMEEEKNLSKKLNDQIFDYMQDYAPAHGLKYVLGYTRGGGILYAADSLDITGAVLEGLNRKYKSK